MSQKYTIEITVDGDGWPRVTRFSHVAQSRYGNFLSKVRGLLTPRTEPPQPTDHIRPEGVVLEDSPILCEGSLLSRMYGALYGKNHSPHVRLSFQADSETGSGRFHG